MSQHRLPVLITAIGGGGHGEQILKALKLAREQNYFIVGADANADCPQFALTDASAVLPLASSPDYLDALLSLCRKYAVKALFHGCEPELKLFSRHREAIRSEGIFLPINDAAVIDTCMNKEKTNSVLSAAGFGVPKFARIRTLDDCASIDFFPVVVKPATGGGGSANVFIAQDSEELQGLALYLGLHKGRGDFFVQEYVGAPDSEFTVGVLHGMDGRYLNAIALKRFLTGALNVRTSSPNRTGRSELGPRLAISSGVSQGAIGRFPEVTAQCAAIARHLGIRGAANIQCRFVDGRVMVFEINPRFSGTTSLRAMVGYNEPDILLRQEFLGETVERDFPYEEGIIIRSLIETRL